MKRKHYVDVVAMFLCVGLAGLIVTGCSDENPDVSSSQKETVLREDRSSLIETEESMNTEEESERTEEETSLTAEESMKTEEQEERNTEEKNTEEETLDSSEQNRKEQKNEFERNCSVTVEPFSFTIPLYWSADITEKDNYRAYAETSGKVAMLEIVSTYDDEDLVTDEILTEETENGAMSQMFASWFDSCGEVTVKSFDNGTVKGYTYQAEYSLDGYDGFAICLCIPDTISNSWIFVTLFETDNTEYSYTEDYDKIIHSISLAPVKEEETTEVEPTQTETAVENTTQEEMEKTNSEIPFFAGTSIGTAVSTASNFGLTEVYDEDFGHGTRCKSLSDQGGGLMIDIVYISSTKEIMCAGIVTSNVASPSEQAMFVKGMASVICPLTDVESVSSWVNDNVGKNDVSTKLGGYTYEMTLGPFGNIVYYAGNAEWEEWECSHY